MTIFYGFQLFTLSTAGEKESLKRRTEIGTEQGVFAD